MDDKINHPSHYCEGRKYEPIDVIADWKLPFTTANCVKYISRAGRKGDAIEDLKKARFYLDYEIKRLEQEKLESVPVEMDEPVEMDYKHDKLLVRIGSQCIHFSPCYFDYSEGATVYIADELLPEGHCFNEQATTIGGYEKSAIRRYIQELSEGVADGNEMLVPVYKNDLLTIPTLDDAKTTHNWALGAPYWLRDKGQNGFNGFLYIDPDELLLNAPANQVYGLRLMCKVVE